MKAVFNLILLTCTILVAEIKADKHPLFGIHGMLIFNQQSQWYASHLPLANSIHSHQIVFSFDLETTDKLQDRTIEQLAIQHELITIVPEVFDLRRLMNNSLTHFEAKVYHGHFERGGTIVADSVRIKIKQVYLNKALTEKSNGHYYVIPTSANYGLLVHRIGASPSFDQILSFRKQTNQDSKVVIPTMLNLANQMPLQQLKTDSQFITILRQLYLETGDFE